MEEKRNHIVKLPSGKYRLYSHEGKNLGTFDSYAEAAKHEGEVQWFKEHKNAKDFPVIFYCRHMENGLAGYENERILVDADCMKKMAPSFAGKPIYVQHQDVNLDTIQDDADGFVADCNYNELDGWLWSKMIVVSDKGKDAVQKGWSVSNAYVPKAWSEGGAHHNVDFDRKIDDAEFTHLAIVPDPRYENAKIFTEEEYKQYCTDKKKELEELRNSKRKPMLKFWKTKREEVSPADVDDDTVVELQNGKTMTVKELLEQKSKEPNKKAKAVENALLGADVGIAPEGKDGHEEEKHVEEHGEDVKINDDEEVVHKGKKMTAKEFHDAYMCSRKENDEDPEQEEGKHEMKDNEALPVKKEEDAGEKEFHEMKNARSKAKQEFVNHVDLDVDQLQRGQDRYGSKK